jgi:2'-5' RNA ligase
MRLFVAIEVPETVRAEIQAVAPQPGPGLRVVKSEQWHLTLHFLGEADLDAVIAALASLSFKPFELRLAGAGQFRARDESVLWHGFEHSRELIELHAEVGRRLTESIGYRPESRPYRPHLTVARRRMRHSGNEVDSFLADATNWQSSPFRVADVVLFQSELTPRGPKYRERYRAGR